MKKKAANWQLFLMNKMKSLLALCSYFIGIFSVLQH